MENYKKIDISELVHIEVTDDVTDKYSFEVDEDADINKVCFAIDKAFKKVSKFVYIDKRSKGGLLYTILGNPACVICLNGEHWGIEGECSLSINGETKFSSTFINKEVLYSWLVQVLSDNVSIIFKHGDGVIEVTVDKVSVIDPYAEHLSETMYQAIIKYAISKEFCF